jgi:solute carrier family 25 protein 33/36
MERGQAKYTGLVQCFRTIAKEEGMAGLYGGLAPHMLRSLPSAIITLGVYEFVLRITGA